MTTLRARHHPEYTRNREVAEAASLLRPVRRAIAASVWVYAFAIVFLAFSPAGPGSGWSLAVLLGVAGAAVVAGGFWWWGGWPPAHVSLIYLAASDLVHTGVLLVIKSPTLALIGTLWFALTGGHLTFAHGRLAVNLHALWALVTIVYFGTLAMLPSNANVPLIIYLSVALLGVLVVAPVTRQLATDALRRDVQSAADLADRDALTSLLNARGLLAAVPDLLAAGPAADLCLAAVVVDLDRFKAINDRYGHHRGDEVLVGVAERLVASSRRGAVVARSGGEEFAVLDTIAPGGEAALAARLLAAVRRAHDDIPVSASVGVASVPIGEVKIEDVAASVNAVLADADAAMYTAKRAGGQRIRVYEPTMEGRR